MKAKSIKDAVHGYIRLEEPYWRIIDTIEFQRLKWIEQTSYRVLFPSARHDRFIHSIGTYHLGQKAYAGFSKNASALLGNNKVIGKQRDAFLLACLLHDIGHAPFSHSCEDLYNSHSKTSSIDSPLNVELLRIVAENLVESAFSEFQEDYLYILQAKDGICKAPSAHEIMSAIITMTGYDAFTQGFANINAEKPSLDLVVRAILGCVYTVNRSAPKNEAMEKGIKNCFIRLLNSSTVDVDKLDYIVRDTFMSGYENTTLDDDRLLDSLSYIIKDGVYYPAFNKSAISVINNVVAAKNAQAKWIVNHPIVIYEFYLLRKSMGISLRMLYESTLEGDLPESSFDHFISEIFSSRSLSKTGNAVRGHTFTLLSDVDIVYHMKKCIHDKDVEEFFSRQERKGPIWKSHAEYLYCLGGEGKKASEVADFFVPLITYSEKIEDLSHPKKINGNLIDDLQKNGDIYQKGKILEILTVLKEYCDDNGMPFEFVILPADNKFSTQINGDHINIRFGRDKDDHISYSSLERGAAQGQERQYKFFYLYSKTKIEAKHFLEYVYKKVYALTPVRV